MNTPRFSRPSRSLRSAASRVGQVPLSPPPAFPPRRLARWLIAGGLLLAGGVWWWLPRAQPEAEAVTAERPPGPSASVVMAEAAAPEPGFPAAAPAAVESSAAADPALPEVLAQLPPGEQVSLQEALFEAMHAITALTEEEQDYPGNEGAAHFVAHPHQRFTARFLREGGVSLGSEREENGWQGTLRLTGVAGTDGTYRAYRAYGAYGAYGAYTPYKPHMPEAAAAPTPAPWRTQGRRAERPTADGALTEWYENRAEGLEHGFTLARRPAGADRDAAHTSAAEPGAETVVLSLALEGLRAEADPQRPGDLRLLEAETGRAVLGYRGLKVWDATGRELEAAMEPSPAGIRLAYHDAGAVYPVTVDPLITVLEAEIGASQKTRFVSNLSGGSGPHNRLAIDNGTAVLGMPTQIAGRGAAVVFVREGSQWKQQARLFPSDGQAGDGFGGAVALDGDSAIVGSAMHFNYPNHQGGEAAYVYQRRGGAWTQQAKLTASDGAAGDRFGVAVALSGDTALVGAHGHAGGRGAAYVFRYHDGAWTRGAKLTSDTASPIHFGGAVALQASRAVIGASGSAYVFRGYAWTREARLDPPVGTAANGFGLSVALNGDTVLVGAYLEEVVAQYSGAVYVFKRGSGPNGVWSHSAKLVPSDAAYYDLFGERVALSGNTALILSGKGSHTGLSNSGAAYLFKDDGLEWKQTKQFLPPAGSHFAWDVALDDKTALVSGDMIYSFPLDSFSATELHDRAHFGLHADLDGDTAVVGALDYNVAGFASAGAAWVFRRAGEFGWLMRQKLTHNPSAADNRFGVSVSLSGDALAVGADGHDEGLLLNAGSVTVYRRDPEEGWLSASSYAHQQLQAQMGRSVAIEGPNLVAGAPGASSNSGQVIFWRRTDPNRTYTIVNPPEPQSGALFGFSVALSGNRALVGEPGRDHGTLTNCGRVYVLADPQGNGNWDSIRQINGRQAHERAGFAVALDRDVAVVGCGGPPGWTVGGTEPPALGAAFVFDAGGGLLVLPPQYLSTEGLPVTAGAYFGWAVAVQGNVIAVGAAGEGAVAGTVRLFQRTGRGGWEIAGPDTQSPSLLLHGHAEPGNRFGGALALSGGTLLVGAFATDDFHINNGAVFLYQILDPLVKPTLDITLNGHVATLRWPLHTGLALWASQTAASGSWFKLDGTETKNSFDIQTFNQPRLFFRLAPP